MNVEKIIGICDEAYRLNSRGLEKDLLEWWELVFVHGKIAWHDKTTQKLKPLLAALHQVVSKEIRWSDGLGII